MIPKKKTKTELYFARLLSESPRAFHSYSIKQLNKTIEVAFFFPSNVASVLLLIDTKNNNKQLKGTQAKTTIKAIGEPKQSFYMPFSIAVKYLDFAIEDMHKLTQTNEREELKNNALRRAVAPFILQRFTKKRN